MLFIDPNGEEIWLSYTQKDEDGNETTTKYQYRDNKLFNENGDEYDGKDEGDPGFKLVRDQLNSLKGVSEEYNGIISFLEGGDSDTHTIAISSKPSEENSNSFTNPKLAMFGIDNSTTTNYNPTDWTDPSSKNELRDPRIGLIHELRHSFDKNNSSYQPIAAGMDANGASKPISVWEANAVNTENILRRQLNSNTKDLVTGKVIPSNNFIRKTYNGVKIPSSYLTN